MKLGDTQSRIVNLDRDLLVSFIAFAEALSFAQAAKRLHLSMPAVHVHVKRLSEALGVTLYERRGRALVLTPAGMSTLAHAREVTAIDARFRASLHGETEEAKLRIAAGEGTFLYLLGPALAQLAKAQIPFAVDVLEGAGVEEAVLHGKADLGVGPQLGTHLLKKYPAVGKMLFRFMIFRDFSV